MSDFNRADEGHRPDDNEPEKSPSIAAKIRLQHELVRVRREAEAARLEANAARLEATAEHLEEMIERIDAGEILSQVDLTKLEPESASGSRLVSPMPSSTDPATESTGGLPGIAPGPSFDSSGRFASWDAIRQARATLTDTSSSDRIIRTDSAHSLLRRPRMQSASPLEKTDAATDTATREAKNEVVDQAPDDEAIPESVTDVQEDVAAPSNSTPSNNATLTPAIDSTETASEHPVFAPVEIVSLDDDDDRPNQLKRRHPLALVLSACIHLLIVILLGAFTLTNAMPKDQVALSASTGESNEAAMETFQIEAVEPMAEPVETSSNETQYDLSPMGEMASVDVTSDVVAAVSQPFASAASLSQPNLQSSSALKALKSDSQSKMEFCGVEGGGNHFVYLVDSSGSMGDAFVSARRALLDSIEMLSPEQRFYVIFFDAECDYMRITRADQDEPRSVYATPENIQRLKSWAMRVSMDRGKAPYEPLEYALQTLKPDVIFLLSDGEFPEKIETILKENNLVTNLFGDEAPVSIIHTISYYSREGESRMRRIAEQNYGQYRHVPKPKSR